MHYLTITELAPLIRTRKIDPVELAQAQLERIDTLDGRLKAFATVTVELALQQARQAHQEIVGGHYRGPLHGIPVAVKDLCHTRGIRTMGGTGVFATHVPDNDATVIERLRDAGAVLLGKLNLTDGAMAGYHPDFAVPENPWKPAHWAGVSSSGSGVATAAGLAFATIGTDTGGSILSPAVRCGVVGLRPTFGRVSRYGVMAAGTTLDKIGPLCRTVEDCGVVLSVIAGTDGLDLAVPDQAPLVWDAQAKSVTTRIGYVPAMMEAETKADARANNARVLATLKAMGCELREVSLPSGDLSYFIEYVERAAAFDAFTRSGRDASLRPRTSRYLRACSLTTAVDYLQANRRRTLIMQEVASVLRDVDALMFTSLTLDSATSLNPVMSLTGHPSIAVPNGFASTGSPTGVMFSGHLYQEGALFALAAAYERARGGATLIPPRFQGA